MFYCSTHTDEELGYFHAHSFDRDYLRYKWETEAKRDPNAIKHFKQIVPKCFSWFIDFCHAVVVKGVSPYMLDTDRLAEVSLNLNFI